MSKICLENAHTTLHERYPFHFDSTAHSMTKCETIELLAARASMHCHRNRNQTVTPSVHSTHTPWKRESLRDYNLRLVRDSRKKWQKFISLRLINVLLPRWFRALSENVRWKKLLIEWCHQRTKICPHSETE